MGEPSAKEEIGGRDTRLPRRITPRLVLPVVLFTLLAQLLTVLVASRYVASKVSVPAYEPFGSSIQGSIGNSLMLVITVFLVTFAMVWLLRMKKASLIKRFLTVFILFTSFFLTLILGEVLLPPSISQVSAALGLTVTTFVGYAFLRPDSRHLGAAASLVLSVEVAAYLSIFIRPPTLLILPVAFALYDLYAVFMGPLKTLISSSERFVLGPLVAKLGELEIGLGDIVFYSFIPSSGLILGGARGALITIIATNLGLLVTLWMLRNRRSFPGLPIPVLLGTGGLLLLL